MATVHCSEHCWRMTDMGQNADIAERGFGRHRDA